MIDKIKIERGIKIPRKAGDYGLPWQSMQVGDSFAYPAGIGEAVARSLAYRASKRFGRTFSVRKVNQKLRAWRMA